MAKQTRLNKNVVAALTVVGMLAVVVGVTALTLANRQRDPKMFAERAQKAEKAGELQQAKMFYYKAYNVNKEAPYLLEAARCAYSIGQINEMFSILIEANAAAPQDQSILIFELEKWWELRRLGQRTAVPMRDYAEKLLALDPNNVLALISQADAFTQLGASDPANSEKADAAFKKAMALDANNPRLALVRLSREISAESAKLQAASDTMTPAERETRIQALRAASIKVLVDAVAAHPDDSWLVTSLADAYTSNLQFDEARKLLEASVATAESVELRLALARFLAGEYARKKDATDKSGLEDLIKQAQQNAGRATELDKAAFDAYSLRIRLMQYEWERTGEWEKNRPELLKKMLDAYLKSLDDTVGIKSARATLDSGGRANLMTQGFDLAMQIVQSATSDEQRKAGLDAARKLHTLCSTQYPDTYLAWMMKGQLCFVDRDLNGATQAYVKVEDKTSAPEIAASASGQIYNRMAKEQLAFLYRETNEPGLALKYTDAAIAAYQAARSDMPRRLALNRGDLLVLLKRGPEALDLADRLLRFGPDDVEFKRMRLRALSLIPGREAEAKEYAKGLQGAGGVDTEIDRARIAAYTQDWDTAEKLARSVLSTQPNNLEALRLLVQVLAAAEKKDAALAFLKEHEAKVTDPGAQRTLKAYILSLSIQDEEQRDVAMLKLINEISDPTQRATELYAHYFSRNNYEQAGAALDELEKLKPADNTILTQQFMLALQRKQLTRAEQYVTRLAAANADSAHGAVFRGQLKYAAGDFTAALAEFRNAEKDLPTDADLKVKIATALVSSAEPRYDEALETLKLALEYSPRHFPAHKLTCVIFDSLGRSQEAIPNLRIAAELQPNDKYIREHKDILDDEVDPKKGVERREKLRLAKPNDILNLSRLAQLYLKLNDAAKAEETLKAAMAVDPPSRDLANTVARFYSGMQRLKPNPEYRKSADAYLGRLISSTDRAPRVDSMLIQARFYEAMSDFADAEQVYKEADKFADTIAQAEEKRAARLLANADLADFYLNQKRYEESNDAYKRALALVKPDDTNTLQSVRLKIIKNYLLLRNFPEAESAISAYLKDNPTDFRAMMARAEMQLARGQLAEGRDTLTQVLKDRPDQTWCLFMRGKANIDLKAYPEAITDLVRVKQLAPQSFNHLHRMELARVYQITDKIDLAEGELRELLVEASGPGEAAQVAMGLVRLLVGTNQEGKAQEFLGKLSSDQPTQPNWPYQLGKLFLNRKDYSNAEPYLRKTVELTEFKASNALFDWLSALTLGNRPADAVAAFEKLDPNQLDPLLRTVGAEAYFKTQKADRGRALLEQAIDETAKAGIEPLAAVATRLGEMKMAPGDREVLLRAALDKAAADPQPATRLRITLARMLIETRDASKVAPARELLEAAAKLSGIRSTERVSLMMLQAQACEVNNELDAAVKAYEAVIKEFPNHAGALNNVAFVLADKIDKPKEAIPYAERARDLLPDNADVLDTLGWAYFKAGQNDRAESTFLEGVRLDNRNLAVWYHLGQVQEKAGNAAAAKKSYQKGLDAAKTTGRMDSDYARKLQEALTKLGG